MSKNYPPGLINKCKEEIVGSDDYYNNDDEM